ncbi:hypothetical protein U1Q18_022222 [Sarracenia purpurea var. burkii]
MQKLSVSSISSSVPKKMSEFREPTSTHDPFKSFKLFVLQTIDYLTTILKGTVLILLVASVSLVLYSAFTSQTQWFRCPECHLLATNGAKLSDETNRVVSSRNAEQTNASHVVFGIGGSSKTWNRRRRYTELWWQPNITRGGDAYGLLAAHPIAPLVSLHHLDSVSPLFPNRTRSESLQTLIRAYRVDPPQTLQQTFCYDHTRKWSVSISWGYTVQIYPSLLTAKDLAEPLQTFQTWRSRSNGPFTFNTRPMKSDPCERPVIYFLDRVEEDEKGRTLTSYEMRVGVGEPENKCERGRRAGVLHVRRIVVLAHKMDPEDWNKVSLSHCFLI